MWGSHWAYTNSIAATDREEKKKGGGGSDPFVRELRLRLRLGKFNSTL